jgi:hypothetical protein
VKTLEDWKVKIAALWLFPLMSFLASMVLMFLEPGILAELLEKGTIEGLAMNAELLAASAVIDILVPLLMVFLSLALKDRVNRWLNIVVGGVYAVLMIVTLVEELMAPEGYVVLMLIAAIVALLLIVWYAWKSKQKA